ncbi:proteasome subunit beta [archaeon]|nr:proteasome subunit beta [archaeon]
MVYKNPQELWLGKALTTGTTTVGLTFKDGVILAADTRATAGYYIAHKNFKKILPVDKHAVMTVAGAVADAQAVHNYIRYEATLYRIRNRSPMPIRSIASLISLVLSQYSRRGPLILQSIVGGVDAEGPGLYLVQIFGGLVPDKYIVTGSGSPIAIGVLEEGYKEDMNREDAIALAVRSVVAAMKRDAATGDNFDVVIVDHHGITELSKEEKAGLAQRFLASSPFSSLT